MRLARACIRILLGWIRFLMVRPIVALSERRIIRGIQVVNISDRDQTDALFEAVAAALTLIHRTAPWRLREVRNVIRRVLIVSQPGSSYWGFVHACALSRETLEHQPPEWVASIIVHEAVHARFHRRGIRYDAQHRSRIERACLRRQLAFLRKVAGTEDLVEHLVAASSKPWFSDAERRRQMVGKLHSLGAPKWLVRWFDG